MASKAPFVFGSLSVPDGRVGPWAIETFDLSEAEASLHNLRCMMNRRRLEVTEPGTYRRLIHDRRGVVMSNTPMEVRTNRAAYRAATGRVLINGLGLGMLLEGVLSKPDVTAVRVIEIDPQVIALTGAHYRKDPRVEIVQADAHTYRPARGERFDYVWHDIWDDIQADNLPSMATLMRRYRTRAPAQGVWSRDMVMAYRR
jgi:hypothetical protein